MRPLMASSAPLSFYVGQRVEAKWKDGSTTWYQGTVKKVNSNGTYAIQFDDGDYEPSEVGTANRMRPMAGAAPMMMTAAPITLGESGVFRV